MNQFQLPSSSDIHNIPISPLSITNIYVLVQDLSLIFITEREPNQLQ